MATDYDLPQDFEALIEQRMSEMFEEANKVQTAIDAAYKAGKKITSVMGPPDVKIGDIIDVMKYNPEHPDGDEETKQKARVLHVTPVEFFNPEGQEVFPGTEVICVLLDENDLTTEDEFKAMYGEGEEESEVQETPEVSGKEISVESVSPVSTDVEVTVEPVRDPNECECGADREMCARNQDMLGYHLNES